MSRHARRSSHARPSTSHRLVDQGSRQAARAIGPLRGSRLQLLGAAVVALVLGATIPAFAASSPGAAPPTTAAAATITAPPLLVVPSGPPLAASTTDVSKVIKGEVAERRAKAKARADRAAARKAAARKKAAAKKAAAVRKAKAAAAARLARQWTWPVARPVFGERFGAAGPMWSSGFHTGQDLPKPTGTAVRAAGSGVVVFAGEDGRYGNAIHIRHKDGAETWYGHLSKIGVKKGQRVTTRQLIGKVGSTGNSTGPHLHFEVHPSATAAAIDPVPWMKKRGVLRK